MYIEWLILLNLFVTVVTIQTASGLLMMRWTKLQYSMVLLFSSLLLFYPAISLGGIMIIFVIHFKRQMLLMSKFLLVLAILIILTGGIVQFPVNQYYLIILFLVIMLVTIRLGRSLYAQHHAFRNVINVTCGKLTIQGYWDSGNLCQEPLSSLPVHFIQQELLEKHPELFEKTARIAPLNTITTSSHLPLYRLVSPLVWEGKKLPTSYFAPISQTEFPFKAQILFHQLTFHFSGGVK